MLFLVSFGGHVVSGYREYNEEQAAKGKATISMPSFLDHPQMWFQSTQNWQSEFMSSAVLVVLTIYLREKGSGESKPVEESDESSGE